MSTYRQKLSPNTNDFIRFLEKSVFHHPIKSVRQFARGSASENYIIRIHDQNMLVKYTHSYDRVGIERLARICAAVSSNTDLPCAKIIPSANQLYFNYQNRHGLIMEYCAGQSVPSYQMGTNHFQQILAAYQQFQKTEWQNQADFLPQYDMNERVEAHIAFVNEKLNQIRALPFLQRHLLRFLYQKQKAFLESLKQTPLTLPPEKLTVIHGDFHNNNLLFRQGRLLAFLDFEEVGYGYIAEDLMRFILCLVQRLPIFINPYTIIRKWLICANNQFHLSKEEWIVGLNSYYLQRVDKVFRPDKIVTRQIVMLTKLALLISRYRHVTRLIHTLPD